MRLAIIAPHFPEYALCYAAAMTASCDVLACVDAGQMAAEFAGRTPPAIPGGQLAPVRFKTPADLWRLVRLVRRFRPDVVHLQEAAGPRRGAFLACVAALLRPSALVVLTVHDPVPHGGRDAGAARRAAWSRNLVRRLADVLVVHGAHCASLLQQDLAARRRPPPQVVQSEHGLILEPAAVQPPHPGPLRLYFFGRMEAYKGVEVLLQAVELLHQQADAIRAVAEDEGLRARLRQGAAETAQGQLDWDRIGRDLQAAFADAAARRRVGDMARSR